MAFDFDTFELALESYMIEPYELGLDPIDANVDAALEAYYTGYDYYVDDEDEDDYIAEEGIRDMAAGVKNAVGKVGGAIANVKREHTWKEHAIPQGEIKGSNLGGKIQVLINRLMNQIDKLLAKLESMSRSKRNNRTIYLSPVAEKALKMINKKDGSKMMLNENGKAGVAKGPFGIWHSKKDAANDDSLGRMTPEQITDSYRTAKKTKKFKTASADLLLNKINALRATARNLKTRIANLKNDQENQLVQTTAQLIKRLNNDANIIRAIMKGSDSISAGTYEPLPNHGQRDTISGKQTGKRSKAAARAIK